MKDNKKIPLLEAAEVELKRQGAEPEMPVNGYSATFINEKSKKFLEGDTTVMKMQNAPLRESILWRAIQMLSLRIAKLEKDLGI